MRHLFLILGISNGGLFLSRQLRQQWPEAIIVALGDPKRDNGRYSNTINRFIPVRTAEEMRATVLTLVKEYAGIRIRAFMCSNPMLEWVVLQYPELFELLDFENSNDVYLQFLDKNRLDIFCSKLNVTVPKEISIVDKSQFSSLPFPLVLKPKTKMASLGIPKFQLVHNSDQLVEFCQMIFSKGISVSDVVCQVFIAGDNRYEYGYGGYFLDGKPQIDVCFYQFRQQPQGLCCYTREIIDESLSKRIKRLVEPILATTRINGFVEFDVKEDASSSQLFLLDANPRPWRSSEMLKCKLENKTTIFSPEKENNLVVWRYPYRELLSTKNTRNVSYRDCKRLSKGRHVKSIVSMYDNSDKKPFLYQLRNDVKAFFSLVLS